MRGVSFCARIPKGRRPFCGDWMRSRWVGGTAMYEAIIRRIDPTVTEAEAAGIVASMRLQYSTLDHLPSSTFRDEIELARQCEREAPGYLASCAAGGAS